VCPQILFGVAADRALQRRGVFLRHPFQRALLRFPFLRADDLLNGNLVLKAGPHARRAADDDRDAMLHGEQADGLVPRRRPAEELGENALAPGVLVGDEAQRAAAAQHFLRVLSDSFLVEQRDAARFTRSHEVFVDQQVVERPHDRRDGDAQPGDGEAGQLVVAEMRREHDGSASDEQLAQHRGQVAEPHVARPGPRVDEPRRHDELDEVELGEVLERLPRDTLQVALAVARPKGVSQVLQGPFARTRIDVPPDLPHQTRGAQVRGDGKTRDDECPAPQRCVQQHVSERGVGRAGGAANLPPATGQALHGAERHRRSTGAVDAGESE